MTFPQAQEDMRHGYLSGATGVLTSGLVWLAAAMVAAFVSAGAAVATLLLGGALIYPLGLLGAKACGRPGTHAPGNPLARLAGEGTVMLMAGLFIAYAVQTVRAELFFPVLLLVIGSRYMTFQTLYGLRTYWACGALLMAAGLVVALTGAPVYAGALAGAVIELATAVVLWRNDVRPTTQTAPRPVPPGGP